MAWTSLKHSLDNSIEDYTGQIAFRTASRAITHIANNLSLTRQSRESSSPTMMVILRGLITARAGLSAYDTEIITAIGRSIIALNTHQNSANSVARTVRLALNTMIQTTRSANVENVRKSLQSASDLVKNVVRLDRTESSFIEVWDAAEADVDRLEKHAPLHPPLSPDFTLTHSWQKLDSHLTAFDESWSVWLIWLRFRLFGITTDEIPHFVWPVIERRMALRADSFWALSETAINAEFAGIIVETVEDALEEEANREQSAFGLTFEVVTDIGKVDLREERSTDAEAIRMPVALEVIKNAHRLIELCDSNSSAHLRERVEEYVEILNGGLWKDEMILVMRGDILRKEFAFQEDWNEDSDIPPMNASILQSLEQIVRLHNILVNSHEALAKADRMLLGPDALPEKSTLGILRDLIQSAERGRILTAKAKLALEGVAKETERKYEDNPDSMRASFSANNFVRTVVRYLWNNKGKMAAGVSSVVVLGGWALANEATLLGYFAGNPAMRLVLSRIFQYLHALPLAG